MSVLELFLKRLPFFWLCLFASQALIAVAAGAFGAHALNTILSTVALAWWATACQYLMYHALAGLVTAVISSHTTQSFTLVYVGFLSGNLFFAGSLMTMSLTGQTWLGAITPIGGVLYLFAWSVLVLRFWRAYRTTEA
jgi:uncharacterized membrane protein YgdD (TMEM256/DUF423 family)